MLRVGLEPTSDSSQAHATPDPGETAPSSGLCVYCAHIHISTHTHTHTHINNRFKTSSETFKVVFSNQGLTDILKFESKWM